MDAHNKHAGDAEPVIQAGVIHNVHVHSATTIPPAARPIAEWNPFALGIHHAITADNAETPLPAYLPRDHDHQLAAALSDTTHSQMIVLVGSSSTGKTRAMYEAVTRHDILRAWPVRCPRTAEQLLADNIPPNTVLWLNEAQEYLTPEVAAHRQSLLDG